MYDDMAGQLEKIIKAYIEKRIAEEMKKFSSKLDEAIDQFRNNQYAQYGIAAKMEKIENTLDTLEWKVNHLPGEGK